MGSFTFKWEHPAEEVYVTGTFDNWTKSVKLDKTGDVFQKTVDLKEATDKIYYKFVVDNNWVINETAPKETDKEGNLNNFLNPEEIIKPTAAAAIINTVTPSSTTAAMAGEQPIETKPVEAKPVETKAVEETPLEEKPVEAKPIDAAEPKETPSDIPGGFPATPANELDKPISINPLPATEGAVNPITLKPGEKIPESITAESITKNVTLDKESYEKAGGIPGVETELPPVSKNTIPESSLPIADVNDATISTVTPVATTAALAAAVPLEPKATTEAEVPAVVKESQEAAKAAPEASAVPAEVEEKAKVEEELKEKVPEVAPTSVGTSGEGTEKSEKDTDVTLAALAATAAAAAYSVKDAVAEKAAPVVSNITDAANKNLPESVKEQLPVVAQDALKEKTREEIAPEVPAEVKESIVESFKSPEAAVNSEAVEEKKAVEAELLKEVKPVPAEGESKTEAPKVEEPKVEEPKVEAPKAEAVVVPVEAKPEDVKPIPTEELKTEAPKVEEPKVEEPKVEEPKTEAPKTEEPKTEAPKAENGATATENGTKTEETKPAESATNGAAAAKKKHNRLSSIFSKIKHKFSDSK